MLYKAEICVWFLIGIFEVLLMVISPESAWRYAFASFALILSVVSFYAWKVDLLQRAREMSAASGGVKVKNLVAYYFTSADGTDTDIWPTPFETVRLVSSFIIVITAAAVFARLMRGHPFSRWSYSAAGVTTITLVTLVVDSIHRAHCH